MDVTHLVLNGLRLGIRNLKTLRFIDGVPVTYYLEVKLMKSMKCPNIYIS